MFSKSRFFCSLFLATPLAFGVPAGAAGPKEVEIVHWWTSGGEAAGLAVLRKTLETQGCLLYTSSGSLIGRDCMSQQPVGTVIYRSEAGEEFLPFKHENLYERALVQFENAVSGEGAPAASGEDGVRSLAVAVATLEAARTGHQIAVNPGL